jgi:hypothetical protein
MQTIISFLITALLPFLTTEVIKKGIDAFLDVIEDAVANSENKIDDTIVVPLINKIREALNITDDEYPDL